MRQPKLKILEKPRNKREETSKKPIKQSKTKSIKLTEPSRRPDKTPQWIKILLIRSRTLSRINKPSRTS